VAIAHRVFWAAQAGPVRAALPARQACPARAAAAARPAAVRAAMAAPVARADWRAQQVRRALATAAAAAAD